MTSVQSSAERLVEPISSRVLRISAAESAETDCEAKAARSYDPIERQRVFSTGDVFMLGI